uniref:DUF4371 domain-containing protein n=1 Tax=Pelodiscus sinensis TaxID=13735 RepID=K7FY10_PELSI
SSSSLIPAKLQRNLETNHSEHKDTNISFFNKISMIKIAKLEKENLTKVSYFIALTEEASAVAEKLIKPCAKDIAMCLLDEQSSKVEAVLLSNTIVALHIQDLVADLRANFCCSWIQYNMTGLAVLLVFLHYMFDKAIEENLLACESLQRNTTGHEIGKCIDVCSDGTRAMIGKTAKAESQIKDVAPNCTVSHCVLHRQVLTVKKMPVYLYVLDEAVLISNYIKTRPIQTVKILCKEMGSQHTALLQHMKVKWRSGGKVLIRLFELCHKELVYFIDHKHQLVVLAYFAYAFTKLNEVNLALQGRKPNIFTVKDKMSLLRKLEFCASSVEEKNFDCFPTLNDFWTETNSILSEDIHSDCVQHLSDLHSSLLEHFPHTNNNSPSHLAYQLKTEILINMTSEAKFQQTFTKFWSNLIQEYRKVVKHAVYELLLSATHLCEIGFLYYTASKTEDRNKFAAHLRIQICSIIPDVKWICKGKKKNHCSP